MRLSEILDDSMKALPPESDEPGEFMRIVLARLIVFFMICVGWMSLILGMLVMSAVRST